LSFSALAQAADSVKTEIGKDHAWTGEAVPLLVTLSAPGPFSGAAAFDLPEIALTAITTTGSPVVGSEEVDGETFYTQRHTFHVYTQQTGDVTVPSFSVRFEWKAPSGSEVTPINGTSVEQKFTSSRPPGTEDMGVVIAAEQFRVQQFWKPDEAESVSPGDLIQRTIEINATGTTAMMLPQAGSAAQDGIRVYTANPEVLDKTQRGETSAQRIDTLKYQFEHPGTFKLPDLEFVWWDVTADELKRETVSGRTIKVVGLVSTESIDAPETADAQQSYWVAIGVLVVAAVCWMFRSRLKSGLRHFCDMRHTPESQAVDRLIRACRSNDPHAAYTATLDWHQLVGVSPGETGVDALDCETRRLAKQLYASPPGSGVWSGDSLRMAILQVCSQQRRVNKETSTTDLPALNPTVQL